jgi:predicted MarR family transcription regulator
MQGSKSIVVAIAIHQHISRVEFRFPKAIRAYSKNMAKSVAARIPSTLIGMEELVYVIMCRTHI